MTAISSESCAEPAGGKPTAVVAAGPRGEQGFVLITVIGVLLILAVIASTLMLASRTENKVRASLVAQAELGSLADGMLHLAALRVATRPRAGDGASRIPVDGTPLYCRDGMAVVEVSISDTAGLIDLNLSSADVLEMLLAGVGVPAAEAMRLAAGVLDFRDSDDIASKGGAEAQAYRQAGLPHGPKNAPFETIDELDQVLGMTGTLFARLAPLVTVHSRSPSIDQAVAPLELLQVLTRGMGARSGQVDVAIPLTRDQFKAPLQLMTRGNARTSSRSGARNYSIRVSVTTGQATAVRQAVIEISSRADFGFIHRQWSARPVHGRAVAISPDKLIACDDDSWL